MMQRRMSGWGLLKAPFQANLRETESHERRISPNYIFEWVLLRSVSPRHRAEAREAVLRKSEPPQTRHEATRDSPPFSAATPPHDGGEGLRKERAESGACFVASFRIAQRIPQPGTSRNWSSALITNRNRVRRAW